MITFQSQLLHVVIASNFKNNGKTVGNAHIVIKKNLIWKIIYFSDHHFIHLYK